MLLGWSLIQPIQQVMCTMQEQTLCLARQEQHCHQVAPNKSDTDFTRHTQLWFNQHRTSSSIKEPNTLKLSICILVNVLEKSILFKNSLISYSHTHVHSLFRVECVLNYVNTCVAIMTIVLYGCCKNDSLF